MIRSSVLAGGVSLLSRLLTRRLVSQILQLSTQSKHLIDTIKMIAYRAETAMASLLRESLSTPDEARRLLQALYQSEADLLPDHQQGTLTVQLHHLANPRFDKVIRKLCEDLNATQSLFPGLTYGL